MTPAELIEELRDLDPSGLQPVEIHLVQDDGGCTQDAYFRVGLATSNCGPDGVVALELGVDPGDLGLRRSRRR